MIHYIIFIVLTILLAYASWTDICRNKYVSREVQVAIMSICLFYLIIISVSTDLWLLLCALPMLTYSVILYKFGQYIYVDKYFGGADVAIILSLFMFLQTNIYLFIMNIAIIASLYWLMFLIKRSIVEKSFGGLFRGIEVPFVPVILLAFVYTVLFQSVIFVSYITGGI